MATARITRHVFHEAAFVSLVNSDKIANNMLARGLLVETKAKQNLTTGPPRRVDTGRLRASIFTRRLVRAGVRGAMVGTIVRHGWYVQFGTGIYGPRHTRIVPKRAKVLVFTPKGATGPVFARSVSGMRPNPFLTDALSAARLR